MTRFYLSDVEGQLIAPLLLNRPRGVARVDDRRVLNGNFYVLRTAPRLLAGLKCRHVVADRGQDADALPEPIRAAGAKPYIPSISQRIVHRSVERRNCRQQNLVERFFLQAQALPTRRHPLREAG